jgi:phosphatidylglycerol:prolipoprotein diacylglycerol transferase
MMHQVLFNIGSLQIRVYGVMTAIAFLTGIYLSSMLAKKKGISPDFIMDLGLVAIACSVIGARLLYVLVWWKYYAAHIIEIFKVWEGGLVFYGGFIGAVIGCIVFIRIRKMKISTVGDIMIIFLPLAHAIGRIGCFYNGCCYGAVNAKFGVIFPAIGDNLPHLPTQLYESILDFANFIILILFYRSKKRKEGEVIFLYLFNYGVIRFFMELLRGDPERGFFFGFSTSIIISVVMIIAGLAGIIFLRTKKGPAA